MNSHQLEHLRKQKEGIRKLREALDDLPPLAWATFDQACAREGHSLQELYEWLDRFDEGLNKTLVNAARNYGGIITGREEAQRKAEVRRVTEWRKKPENRAKYNAYQRKRRAAAKKAPE